MVQIIQEREKQKRPSFMDRLGNAAGTAAELIPQYLMQKEKMQKENEMINKLTGLDLSGTQDPKIRQMAVQLALQGQQKQEEMGINAEQAQRMQAQKSMDQFNQAQELQYQKAQQQKELEGIRQQGKKSDSASMKIEQEQKQKQEVRQTAQNSFNTMAQILRKGNIGRGSGVKSFFGGETANDTGKFLSASAGLEAMLVDMVSRGTLSNTRFKYITETVLPKPTDSDAEIEGKLSALSELLGLDPSALTGSSKNSEKQSLQDIFG